MNRKMYFALPSLSGLSLQPINVHSIITANAAYIDLVNFILSGLNFFNLTNLPIFLQEIYNWETKKAALEEIISFATTRCTLDDAQLRELIWKREKMMTTAVGKGLALPHIRVNDIPAPVIIIGVAKNDIADYVAQDGKPVRVIVFMAAPDENQDAYLQLLGSVSRKMREDGVIEKLLESTENAAVLYNTVTAL